MSDPPSYIVNNPLVPGPGSILSYWLSGSVTNYADLPSITPGQGVGQAWLVNSESMVYIWDGTAFPAQGAGASWAGGGGGGSGTPGHDLIAVASVTHYTDLPGGLDTIDEGKGYLVIDDGLLYVWDGSAFPALGSGIPFRGPQGPTGATGATGNNGLNAGANTAASFTVPAVNSNVTVFMGTTAWMSAGQIVYIATAGYYFVVSISSGIAAVLQNLGYPSNAAEGTVIAAASLVAPGGVRGATGGTGGAGVRGSQWAVGSGTPGTIAGQADGDFYLNSANGDVYKLVSGTWTLAGNIQGPPATNTALIFASGNSIPVTNTTTETTIGAATIPANTLGADGAVRFRLGCQFQNNSGSAQTVTFAVKYGATTLWQGVSGSFAAAALVHAIDLNFVLGGGHATNAQFVYGSLMCSGAGTSTTGQGSLSNPPTGTTGFATAIRGTAAEDSTTALNLTVTVTLSAANTSLTLTRDYFTATVEGAAGPRGLTGANGTAGAAGVNAFTTTAASATQPAVNSTVSVQVASTAWMAVGQVLYVASGGYYSISSITDGTHVVLTNLGATGNASPGATVASGSAVAPAGAQGATGSAGAGLDPVVRTLSIVSGVVTVDSASGAHQYFNLPAANFTGNATLAISNPPTSGNGAEISIELQQDGTGGRTLALPSSFKAMGNSDTAIQSAANAKTQIIASTNDGGATWKYAMGAIAS